jgi:uncharacterized repeat protein (TIGR01451 family)
MSFEVVVGVPATLAGQTLSSSGTITGDQPDSNTANDSATVPLTVGPLPPPETPSTASSNQQSLSALFADLAVTKSGPATATTGQHVTYTVTIVNNGGATATAVHLADTIAGTARILSAQPSAGSCTTHAPIACALGNMAAGASIHLLITLEPLHPGTLSDTASVTSASADATPANDIASASTHVTLGHAKVRITERASLARVHPGQTFTYRITVQDSGPAPALDLRVCDRLPLALVFAATPRGARIQHGQACWSYSELDLGIRHVLTLRVRATRAPRSVGVRNTVLERGANVAHTAASATVALLGASVTACGKSEEECSTR